MADPIPNIVIPPVSGSVPPPASRWVAGFPAHTTAVSGLPLHEKIELYLLAEWAIETHGLGNFPVTKITCIGHADRDYQRGEVYEDWISKERADAVMDYFKDYIYRHTSGIPVFSYPFTPIYMRFSYDSDGVGSREHIPATDEIDRLKNRMVEMIFERGRPPVPPPAPPFKSWEEHLELIRKVLNGAHYPDVPVPNPWFQKIPDLPKMPPGKLEELLQWLKDHPVFSHLDLGSFAQAAFAIAQQAIEPMTDKERQAEIQKLAVDISTLMVQLTRDTLVRTADPPGEPTWEDEKRRWDDMKKNKVKTK